MLSTQSCKWTTSTRPDPAHPPLCPHAGCCPASRRFSSPWSSPRHRPLRAVRAWPFKSQGESRTWDKLSFCWLTTSPPSWTREETPKFWVVVSVSSAQVTRSLSVSLTSSSSSRGLTLTRSNSFLACLVCQQSFQRQCTTSFFWSHANARTCIRAGDHIVGQGCDQICDVQARFSKNWTTF